MTYSLDGIISNAVVRSGGAGRSGLHWILLKDNYNKFIDNVIILSYLLTCDPPADDNASVRVLVSFYPIS